MQPSKDSREATVELITAALLVGVFILFAIGNIREPLAMLAGGLILLGSGVYQTTRGWHVSLITWILGVILFLGGIGVRLFLVSILQINWVFIAVGVVALYLIFSFLGRRG
jgi:hypothetical protein